MKTYSAKSSAVRAAKKALGKDNFNVSQEDDGKWSFSPLETKEEEKVIEEPMEQVMEEEILMTDLEAQLLYDIAHNYMSELNGGEPDTVEQTSGYSYAVITTKSEGGVMTSLTKKELAWFEDLVDFGIEDEASCGLTDVGFRIYKEYDYVSLKERQAEKKQGVAPTALAVTEKEEQEDKPKKVWKRPGEGTKTGRVWELADELQARALVLEAGAIEGLNLNMISQQFYRWSHSH